MPDPKTYKNSEEFIAENKKELEKAIAEAEKAIKNMNSILEKIKDDEDF